MKRQLKVNPLNCTFDVMSGNSLGFVIQHRGVEVNQAKRKPICDMPHKGTLESFEVRKGTCHTSEDLY